MRAASFSRRLVLPSPIMWGAELATILTKQKTQIKHLFVKFAEHFDSVSRNPQIKTEHALEKSDFVVRMWRLPKGWRVQNQHQHCIPDKVNCQWNGSSFALAHYVSCKACADSNQTKNLIKRLFQSLHNLAITYHATSQWKLGTLLKEKSEFVVLCMQLLPTGLRVQLITHQHRQHFARHRQHRHQCRSIT